jgi:excisionase family DNA binding protein
MQNPPAVNRRSDWLSLSQAADYLGISQPTLRKWTDAGRVRVFRTPGGHRRYQLKELIAFRNQQVESQTGFD